MTHLATSAIWASVMLSSLFLSSSSSSMMSNTLSTPCRRVMMMMMRGRRMRRERRRRRRHLLLAGLDQLLGEVGQLAQVAVLAPHTLQAGGQHHSVER